MNLPGIEDNWNWRFQWQQIGVTFAQRAQAGGDLWAQRAIDEQQTDKEPEVTRLVRKAVFLSPPGDDLPATKASRPKEMLPIVDKPLIQYAVEEAVAAGIEVMVFVTGRNKSAISTISIPPRVGDGIGIAQQERNV